MPSPIPGGRKAPSPSPAPVRGRARRARGAALLTAMVSVAVLTALAVDLAYQSRVSLNIAANARDELRAHYQARSGVAMGRLILSFQQKLDGAMGQTAGLPRVQLWNLVPVDQSLVEGLFAGGPAGGGSLFATQERRRPAAEGGSLFAKAAQQQPQPAPAHPTFDAQIDDEGRKVNAQFTGLPKTDLTLRPKAQALYQLICDGRWDPLFDREDANGLRSTREDVLVRLRDWVDEQSTTSELGVGGGTSAQCGLVIGQPPFVDAFGDENQPYDRGDDRYRTKNARMDSLDELYLVAGIGDAFMAAFGDQLTVYLLSGDKRNVNVKDKSELVALAGLMADPPGQPALLDPEFANRLDKVYREKTLGGILTLSAKDLGALVELSGVKVNQAMLAANNVNSPFTDRSTVFRIRATGKAGVVRSTIDAVVRLEAQNTQRLPGEQVAAPGRIIHWRED